MSTYIKTFVYEGNATVPKEDVKLGEEIVAVLEKSQAVIEPPKWYVTLLLRAG